MLILDKPSGISSAGLIRSIQHRFHIQKAGHGGTLDPMATGVLLMCVNEATKMAPYLLTSDKVYEGTLLLGVETDTYDLTGKIIATDESKRIDDATLKDQFQKNLGWIEQRVPVYSAVKQKGKPLYHYARNHKKIECPIRKVRIDQFEMMGRMGDEVRFHLKCSKGTYVRALCHDVGHQLGTVACLKTLKRVQCGLFHLKDAISADALTQRCFTDSPHWISLREMCRCFASLSLTASLAKKVRNGYQPRFMDVFQSDPTDLVHQPWICFLDETERPLAMAIPQKERQLFQLTRVFNV